MLSLIAIFMREKRTYVKDKLDKFIRPNKISKIKNKKLKLF